MDEELLVSMLQIKGLAADDVDRILEHAGVKGMRWGVRKDRPAGTSRKTDREASKDAEEFARAKMFYGSGAGTRRKLIKASVEAKSKRDPKYAEAFKRHLDNQDLSTHAEKARTERSRTDRKEKNTKRAGYIARRFTGEMGTQAAFTAAALAGAAFINSPKGRALARQSVTAAREFRSSQSARNVERYLVDFFSRQG